MNETSNRYDAEAIAELSAGAELYGFLGKVFLALPDASFLDELFAMDWSRFDIEGFQLIGRFAESHAGRPRKDVLEQLGCDRAALVRGVGFGAIEPPYESLYRGASSNVSIGGLNRFYSKAGYAVDKSVKDTSDQIGVELSFVSLMYAKELESAQAGDGETAAAVRETRERFFAEHLSCWAADYARAMEDAAQTDFYRGIAQIIQAAV